MSYGKTGKKEYEQPQPQPTGLKGKPGFKSKGDFEKDLITRSSEKAVRENKEPKPAE